MRKSGRVLCGAVAVAVAYCSGCSFIFVSGPSRVDGDVVHIDCTSSRVAPIFDTIFTVFQVGRTVAAVAASDSTYEGAPISRGADIGFGVGFTALFLSSAIYGFSKTAKCRRLLRSHDYSGWTRLRWNASGAPELLRPVSGPLRLDRPRIVLPNLDASDASLDHEVVISGMDCDQRQNPGLIWDLGPSSSIGGQVVFANDARGR